MLKQFRSSKMVKKMAIQSIRTIGNMIILLLIMMSFGFSNDDQNGGKKLSPKNNEPFRIHIEDFGDRQDWGELEYNPIDEASGLVASRKNENVFWVHNDSGDNNRIYAFNNEGRHLGVYYLDGCSARDWEDMATGPGPVDGEQYLYIGEIGDNDAEYNLKYIYRIIEPTVDSNQSPITETIYGAEIITYQYPDGNRDAETLMVDPLTKDIYIISKREEPVNIYQLTYPQSTSETLTPEFMMDIDFYPEFNNGSPQYIVAGDISADGLEILVKSYLDIFYFSRNPDQTLMEAFNQDLITVSYILEVQGEALAWHPQGFGYFTTSEEKYNVEARLYFYPDLVGCMDSQALNYNPYATVPDWSCEYLNLEAFPNPNDYALYSAYPNPFNPTTTLRYDLPEDAQVRIMVYDLMGRSVKTLVNNQQTAGFKSVIWDATNDLGQPVSAGMYLYRISAGDFRQTKKIVLLK